MLTANAWAQKSMSLKDCEVSFQKNNLQLLAQHYEVDAAKAAVIQAKIWDTPYLSIEANAYSVQDQRWFENGGFAYHSVTIQQLIYLGGKKRKEAKAAQVGQAIAELQFEQMLSDLRNQLHQSFFTVYFEQKKVDAIELQKASIDSLLRSYSEQAKKGNIPLKEVVRLQSLSLDFNNERLTLLKGILEEKENLKILTGQSEAISPIMDEEAFLQSIDHEASLSKKQLVDSALVYSPDYQSALKEVEMAEETIKWQKSLAIPDLTIGAGLDQSSGSASRLYNLSLGIPLPIWNKNKGNILMAKAKLEQSKLLKDQKALELRSKIESAYDFRKSQYEQYLSVDKQNLKDLELVYKGELKNIAKRNISLIEFTDFMSSYNQTIMNANEMHKQLILSSEQLNYLTHTKVF